jgi:CRISPR system Cascade subunit CasA
MSENEFRFNLWHDPWIRVTRPDGTLAEYGIGSVLREAHTLAAFADASPLVVAGTQRLLAAILQAIIQPKDLDDIEACLFQGQFSTAALNQFAEQYQERFELFHPTMPFLQTGEVPLDGWKKAEKGRSQDWQEPKSISTLFVEIPTDTARALFHHVSAQHYQCCPACAVRGILTIPSFASSGGAGIRPSINGVPPIYVLPSGSNLFMLLTLSLVAQNYLPPMANPERSHAAIWNAETAIGKNRQVSGVSYLESLVFPARRMRLYPTRVAGDCSLCGSATAIVVRELLFEMGHWLSEGSGIWEDPFAAYRLPRGAKPGENEVRPIRPEEGKALWREYSGLFLAQTDQLLRPRIVRQLAALVERGVLQESQAIQVRTIGLRTDGKAKIFEWLDEALDVPPQLLTDPDAPYLIDSVLQLANNVVFILRSTFNRHFRPERAQGKQSDSGLSRFQTVRARMEADYWLQLAPLFRELVSRLAETEQREPGLTQWAAVVMRVAFAVFDAAAEQIGDRSDALKARVEGQAACRKQCFVKRIEWLAAMGIEMDAERRSS